ncbi:hypothetical protein ATX23_09315 [Oenococcus oeni]|uniref:hypothetical protein n=1 Tax=Oenococcus oeni TaxID=1247 RepID=UPI0008F8260B|nr:hypothetical protein [Oenococcus oeni]OIL58296.1 hypothetical protein ATX23_09315 [Oenococcus oeni]
MSLALQVTILDANSLQIKGIYPALSYDIFYDYVDNSTSTLVLNDNGTSQLGDYVAVKVQNTNTLLYFGMLSDVQMTDDANTNTLTAVDIRNVLNGDIIVTAKTGTSRESHLIKLIKNYIASNSSTNLLSFGLSNSTNTAFTLTNSDTIDTYNFVDYITRCFTLQNIVMSIKSLAKGASSNGVPFYYPVIDVHKVSNTITLKNNIAAFTGWTVDDSRLLRGYANELWIVDQASTDMENPTILSKYWLQKDGTIVSSINSNVIQPTQVVISLFDKTATDNPTYAALADETLTGNEYSHQIQFPMPIQNNFFSISQLEIGLLTKIYYVQTINGKSNTTIYNSVLSAYEISSDSNEIILTFGNLRSSAKDVFSSSD